MLQIEFSTLFLNVHLHFLTIFFFLKRNSNIYIFDISKIIYSLLFLLRFSAFNKQEKKFGKDKEKDR